MNEQANAVVEAWDEEAEPRAPDTSRLAEGAREIRESFDLKERERIQKAKALNTSDAFMALNKLKRDVTPPDVELAVLIASVEKCKLNPESARVEFLGTINAAYPKHEKTWLKNLRKAVKNIIKAADRAAAKGTDTNVVNADDFLPMVRWGLKKLEGANSPSPRLLLYGSEVAEIRFDPLTGDASISTLDYQTFKARVNAVAPYRKAMGDSGAYQGVSVPDEVARMMYAEPKLPLPPLLTLTRAPVFTADGQLVERLGYHESGLYYAPPEGLALDLPQKVSDADVKAAIEDLAELFCDFEMDGVSRADFLAAVVDGEGDVPPSFLSCVAWLLEQPCRALIGGPVMPLLISKTTPGAGGGLLAKVMQIIVQGSPSSRQLAKGEDERRKAFYTALKSSPATIFWDNLPAGKEVDSAALASLFTEPVWTDRELGRSGERSLPVLTSFALVGNRPLLSDELRRRMSLCELLPQTANPEARADFLHPDLLGHVKKERRRYVRAVLILALNWMQKRRPAPSGSTAPGSYEDWHRVIVGILEAAAPHWNTWGTNRKKLATVAGSDDTTEIDELLSAWANDKHMGLGSKVTAAEVCHLASRAMLELPVKRTHHGDEFEYSSKSMGHYLKSFADRVFKIEGDIQVRVRQHETREKGGFPWVLERVPTAT